MKPGQVLALLFTSAAAINGWGPHPEIVDAAISALPSRDQARLVKRFGNEARQLRHWVWMGDYVDQFIGENTGDQFYANDYLIFPSAPRRYGHGVPDVKNTYTPFFLRVLQAIGTETPGNASRWLGSLLHFTTDTGAPPHAAGISGETHSRMENWIDGRAISIDGYEPHLLGDNPTAAVRGFEQRMAGLIEFSKIRAERLYSFVNTGDRRGAEPIVLESANETARVTADLFHTLLFLSEQGPELPPGQKGLGELQAYIIAPNVAGVETIAAKLMLIGTNYSTMSEMVMSGKGSYRGVFLLRNLRPGSYSAVVSRVGNSPLYVKDLSIQPGQTAYFEWNLGASSPVGNIVRNPDFSIRWTGAGPDNWRFEDNSGGWVSDNIRVHPGATYRLEALPRGETDVLVRLWWYKNHWQPAAEPVPLTPGKQQPFLNVTAPENAQYVRLVIAGKEDPARALTRMALVHGDR